MQISACKIFNQMKQVITFVKNPVLGHVKTRLAKSIGDEQALNFYLDMLKQTSSVLLHTCADKTMVYYDQHIVEKDLFDYNGIYKYKQEGDDLGQRMENAFSNHLLNGPVVLIGSDCPDLTSDLINRAFDYLNQVDVVLGHSLDGGYYLIGMKELHTELFREIPWSTPDVFYQTISRCKESNLSYAILPSLMDIDTIEDYSQYYSG